MTATNRILSIIAFYLSEYDMKAVKALGFQTRTFAINSISAQVGSGNNYLKLRRDEFDALSDSASSRKGWRNRPPLKDVVELARYLHQFSFDELTEIVKAFLADSYTDQQTSQLDQNALLPGDFSEDDIERIVNRSDPTARIRIATRPGFVRVYNKSIIMQMKALYRGNCQICGCNPVAAFGTAICEAHHIEPFSVSQNNNPSNIIILCPNHHRLIHKGNLTYDPATLSFHSPEAIPLLVQLDYHLKQK